MKRHPFEKYLITRDNYLEKPYDVIEMSKTLIYNKNPNFPGVRTDNLLSSPDPEIKRFAEWFTNELSYDVFPGISMYETFLCFHKYNLFNDEQYNTGWVHTDYGNLAGLIYLTPGEDNINTGTSIFEGDGLTTELPTDKLALEEFYINGNVTEDFKTGFERNRELFANKESVRVGNKFNRLVAYDSKMWHRPNYYGTSINQTRLSLLFFISQFDYIGRN